MILIMKPILWKRVKPLTQLLIALVRIDSPVRPSLLILQLKNLKRRQVALSSMAMTAIAIHS